MYTLIETAKREGVNPQQYLAATVSALLRGDAVLLPHAYAAVERRRAAAVDAATNCGAGEAPARP